MTAVPRPRPRPSRAVEAQEGVKELILQRGLAAGDPLPTESELMEELGVSRNSIREALKALQAVGIVDIRHGFGMFVGRMSLAGLVDELAFHSRITLQDGRNDARPTSSRSARSWRSAWSSASSTWAADVDLTPVADVIARMEAEAVVGRRLTGDRPALPRPALPAAGQPAGRPAPRRVLGRLPPAPRRPRRAGRDTGRRGPAAPRHLHGGARRGQGAARRPMLRPLRRRTQPPGQAAPAHLTDLCRAVPGRWSITDQRRLSISAVLS